MSTIRYEREGLHAAVDGKRADEMMTIINDFYKRGQYVYSQYTI